MPDIELLVKISELYGVSVDDIIKAHISKIKFNEDINSNNAEKTFKRISVIGCGRWGALLAGILMVSHKPHFCIAICQVNYFVYIF
ncbi:hypothetical protein IAI10_01410 [Clostridium sp. 19966]|nr:hypothetical protein [Clostridium sp. 19966]